MADFVDDEEEAARRGCEDLWVDYSRCVASGDGCFDGDAEEFCDREESAWDRCMDAW